MNGFFKIRDFFKKSVLRKTAEFSVSDTGDPLILTSSVLTISYRVFIHGIFSNFAYILLSDMSGMGLLMGKIRPFLTELLPFFVLEKWFLACYSITVHDI